MSELSGACCNYKTADIQLTLKVAATLVKLAMPPPMMSTLPCGCLSDVVMRWRIVLAYSNVCCSLGAPEYSP